MKFPHFLLLLAAFAPLTFAAPPESPRPVRLLTVGNSFSQNATHYLADLAQADGQVLKQQSLVVGGAPLSLHWEKAEQFEADPKHPNGRYGAIGSLREVLSGEPWDFVTIQQASIRSHDLATYRPYAAQLQAYIQKYAPKATLLLHETWAYRVDDPRFKKSPAVAGEPASSEAMYQALRTAYGTIAQELGLRLIPVGEAFHLAANDPQWAFRPDTTFDLKNAQPPALPNQAHSLNRGWMWQKGDDGKLALRMDGHHASTLGEYLGACVWYEVLFGRTVVGNSYRPAGVSEEDARYLQNTAHHAVAESAPAPALMPK